LFFMGFNEFYFLNDNATASEYLMQGSKRPDAPSMLQSLAVRLAYKGDRTKLAIAFIQESLKTTKDESIRKEFEIRKKFLQGVLELEQAVEGYQKKYGMFPPDLKALRDRGVIARIPSDPYGGTFYLTTDGSVKSTSNMFYVKK